MTDKTATGTLRRSPAQKWLHWILAGVFLLAGAGYAYYLLKTPPRAARQKPEKVPQRVSVLVVRRQPVFARVEAMGTVKPSREITLSPEVAGLVVEVCRDWAPGGRVQKGQMLVRIDPRDYQAALRLRESELAAAEFALTLEQAAQKVAQTEYQLLGGIVDPQERSLVLRQPHLQKAQESVDAARAALEKAQLDVQRCQIVAPFDAVIISKSVDVGSRVSPGSPLAALMATDIFWVEAQIPVEQLQWLNIDTAPENASGADILLNDRLICKGWVSRLLGQLEPAGRMAQILISVADPLGFEKSRSSPLLVGSYVRAVIEGKAIDNAVALPRRYLRENNTVWIADQDNILRIRPVKIALSLRDVVYIEDGLSDGQRVVRTFLPAPVDGMDIAIAEQVDKE